MVFERKREAAQDIIDALKTNVAECPASKTTVIRIMLKLTVDIFEICLN
jgi:hypothetical protein